MAYVDAPDLSVSFQPILYKFYLHFFLVRLPWTFKWNILYRLKVRSFGMW